MNDQQKIKSADIMLGELVGESQYLFHVPNYQRYYAWTEKEVSLFLKDGEFCWRSYVEGNRIFEHFAGQLILRKVQEDRANRSEMEIVDGQQRLTTFTLLVVAVVRIMRRYSGGEARAESLEKKYLVSAKAQGETVRILKLSKVDQDYWERLTDLNGDPSECKPKAESHKRLQKAEAIIREYLEELIRDQEEEKACDILDTYVKAMAESFRFVLLKTTRPGYVYALYQIVNNRGTLLTSGELLKARTLELLTVQASDLGEARLTGKKSVLEAAEKKWDDILADPGSTTDGYLEWNYMALTGKKMESRAAAPIHEQYEKDIFCCCNKRILSEEEQKVVVEQLEQLYVNVYRLRKLENGIIPAEGISQQAGILFWMLVKRLKNKSCIPLYLKILEMKEKKIAETVNNVTPMLAKAFFIAKTMGGFHDEVISKCYLDIWTYIDENRADLERIRNRLEQLIQRDDCRKEFSDKIDQEVYAHGAAANAKVIFLLLMAELNHHKEVEGGRKEYGDDSAVIDPSRLSVEHILSDSVDPREVSKSFYSTRQRIGNLTLLGQKLNTREKNKPFEEKRIRYQASPYWITREVGQLEHWKKEDFDRRQAQLREALERAFEL